jgi:photosystem I subunit 11
MADRKDEIQPVSGDPQIGNLETPINSSGIIRAYINSLPAYRPNLSPQRRGLEIGMAHGYWLFGPYTVASQFRNSPVSDYVGLFEAIVSIVVLTIALSLYASVGAQKPVATVPATNPPQTYSTEEGWSEFAGGFLIGGVGGAGVAYLVYQVVKSGVLETFGNLLS